MQVHSERVAGVMISVPEEWYGRSATPLALLQPSYFGKTGHASILDTCGLPRDFAECQHGGQRRQFQGHELTVNGLAVGGASDSVLLSGSRDWTVRVWDVETGHETARNTTHQYAPATRNRAARCTRHAMGHPPEALGRV